MTKPPEIQPIRKPKWVRYMIAAGAGFGKTVHAGTAEKAIFLTTDPEGTASAAAFGSTAEEWPIHDEPSFWKAMAWLESGGAQEEGFKTLVVDNTTEVQNIFKWGALAKDVARAAAEKQKERNPYVADKPHYGIAQNALIDVVKRFNALSMNVIYTAHRQGLEGEDAREFWSVAIQGGQGQVAQMILGYMNIVGMGEVVTEKDKQVRRIFYTHWQKYRGKDRYNILGGFQDDLSFPEMLELLYEEDGGQDAYIAQCEADDAARAAAARAVKPRPRPRPAA